MKLFFFLALLLFVSQVIIAQNIGINSTGATPNNAAMLDIDVSALVAKKGLLIPRVTAAEKIAMDPLAAPAQGLLIYQTDAVEGFYYNTSTTTTPVWTYLLPNNGTDGGWGLSGNAGTVDGTNFIGTTDDVPLTLKVNNQKAGYISNSLGSATFFGYQAGIISTGTNNSAFGDFSLYSNTTGFNNSANGSQALYSNTTGFYNTANGFWTLYRNTTGNYNTANGARALYSNTTGNYNAANGYNALFSNTTGRENIANGANALAVNTTGSYNTANGYYVLSSNTTGNSNAAFGKRSLLNSNSSKNTAVGDSAGYENTTGSLNTYIGYQSNGSATLTNATAIGANASVTASNSLVLGNNANVGIGTTSPSAKLEVAGQVKITGGTPGAGKVLTSDATGLATWSTLTSSNEWKLDGNTGTNAGLNFIGTTDSIDLAFKTNNLEQIRLTASGNLGIGNTSPTEKLEVQGKTKTSTLQVITGAGVAGQILMSDALGNATWQTIPSAVTTGWGLLGNAGTSSATNFIGTTDDVPLRFKVGNQKSGYISNSSGNATHFGYQAGNNTTSPSNYSTAFGCQALYSNTSGIRNTATGYTSLYSNTTGVGNTANGYRALYNNRFNENTAIGSSALYSNVSGSNNTAAGAGSLENNTSGYNNVAMGYLALRYDTIGNSNTAVGMQSLYNTNSSKNTALGDSSGYSNTTGSLNTYLGHKANGSATITNATAIGANTNVTTSNSMVLGNNVNVGIGTSAPSEKLEIVGKTKTTTLQVTTGATTGNVLMSDASGNATWQPTSITAWDLTGNTGLSSLTNYIGSNDAVDFIIKTNNLERVRVLSSGNTGIGTITPLSKLDIRSTNVTTASATPGILNVMSNNAQGADIGASISLGGFNDNAASVIRVFGTIEGRKTNSTTATSSGYLSFKTNNAGVLNENMRIDNTGNVGIGCTAPGYKLHVIGDIASSATIRGVNAYVTGAITACSDVRYKKDFTPLKKSLDIVLKMEGFNYYWNQKQFPDKNFNNQKQIGFKAQDLQKLLPEVVFTDTDGFLSIDYSRLTPVLVEAIKEQQQTIEEDKKKMIKMEAMMEALNKRLSALENTNTLTAEAKNND